jgi:phenylalanyl-tRNA synthetase alpha chain
MPVLLSPEQLASDLSVRDLSDPDAGPHAIQILLDRAVRALAGHWGCPVRWRRGERIVPVADNYDLLGYDPADVTREARYSRYVAPGWMLRSHATALIPGALRRLAAEPADDVLLVCAGVVYRRDAIDRLHTGTPHQADLWRVTRRPQALTASDLEAMISTLLGELLPGVPYRLSERVHPYTLDGRQVDVRHGGEWVEIGECGLADPGVLARAGLDGPVKGGGEVGGGLALGVGLDRLLMLMKEVPDIRLLRSADPRVTAQMLDLARYTAVSTRPPVTRDLSVAVAAGDLAEDLGDRVREALEGGRGGGWAEAACVESVRIVTRTPCAELPAQALARLGARPDQDNLLVRVVLRGLDRTLTDQEANGLRDRVYAAIHQGSVRQCSTVGTGNCSLKGGT